MSSTSVPLGSFVYRTSNLATTAFFDTPIHPTIYRNAEWKDSPFSFLKNNPKHHTPYGLRHSVFKTRHLKMTQDVKWSNRGRLIVKRRTGVEEHLSETHALSAISSMNQVDCQEVLRGPSVGVFPMLLRNCVSCTTLSSAAGMISSLADVRTYLYMCFKFYTLCVKETLLQTLGLGDVLRRTFGSWS
jgi:hypothetical protein